MSSVKCDLLPCRAAHSRLSLLLLLCSTALTVPGCTATPLGSDFKNEELHKQCLPGFYLARSKGCSPCPSGYFQASLNRERNCNHCSQDCREVLHLEVYMDCNATSDVRCRCRQGFICTSYDPETQSCSECEASSETTVSSGTALPSCKAGTFFNASSGGCELHVNCTSLGRMVLTAGNSTHNTVCHPKAARTEWWWYLLLSLLVLGLLTTTSLIWRRELQGCLKHIIKLGAADGHKKENRCAPRRLNSISGLLSGMASNPSTNVSCGPDLDCRADRVLGTEQPSQATGSLGPFHIYSAGTVFVSLLNQVTGVEKDIDKEWRPQMDDRDRLSHPAPPSSPPVHLSQEEKDGHRDCIFFPSQEQGKEIHLSKEERM